MTQPRGYNPAHRASGGRDDRTTPVADHERVAGCARAGRWRRKCPAAVAAGHAGHHKRDQGRQDGPRGRVELRGNRARARKAAGIPQGEREVPGLHRRRQRRLVRRARLARQAPAAAGVRTRRGRPLHADAGIHGARPAPGSRGELHLDALRQPVDGHLRGDAVLRVVARAPHGGRPKGSGAQARTPGGELLRFPAGDVLPLDTALARRVRQGGGCAGGVVRWRSAHRELRHLARRRRTAHLGRQRCRRGVQAAVLAGPGPAGGQRAPGNRIAAPPHIGA